MKLTEEELAWTQNEFGAAKGMATRILAEMGRVLGADRLIPITSAHIDGCLYHGDSGVVFAEKLVEGGGQVVVPTSLNVGSIDERKPEQILFKGNKREMASRLMQAYRAMGCKPTWTCAPYQVGYRPQKGEDIGWAESNAVVFANSVLGAQTNRYGDFLDICAAITGRVPRYGLHIAENRFATVVLDTSGLSDQLKENSSLYPVLGAWLGLNIGTEIGVFDGLPQNVSDDALKGLGAAAASTGAVALFHVTGRTPEAATLDEALGHKVPKQVVKLTPSLLNQARQRLSTTTHGDRLDVVSLGSPHYSITEIEHFESLRDGRQLAVPVYINTSRFMLALLDNKGMVERMEAAGVRFITDTCIVVTPILREAGGVLLTDSGKFATYTPPNTGYEVAFASAEECVESAVKRRLMLDEGIWK